LVPRWWAARLVEKQNRRLERQGARQGEQLLLAARQQACRLSRALGQADVLQQGPAAFFAEQSAQLQHEVDVCRHRAAKQDGPLEDHRLTASDRLAQRCAAPDDLARARLDHAVQEAQQKTLARPGRPQDQGHRSGGERKVHPVDEPVGADLQGQAAHAGRQQLAGGWRGLA
jgi:hypothetical protein